jgi:hypothetical protein
LGGTALPEKYSTWLVHHTRFALRTVSGVKQNLPQHPGCGQQIFLMEMCDPETKGGLVGQESQ